MQVFEKLNTNIDITETVIITDDDKAIQQFTDNGTGKMFQESISGITEDFGWLNVKDYINRLKALGFKKIDNRSETIEKSCNNL